MAAQLHHLMVAGLTVWQVFARQFVRLAGSIGMEVINHQLCPTLQCELIPSKPLCGQRIAAMIQQPTTTALPLHAVRTLARDTLAPEQVQPVERHAAFVYGAQLVDSHRTIPCIVKVVAVQFRTEFFVIAEILLHGHEVVSLTSQIFADLGCPFLTRSTDIDGNEQERRRQTVDVQCRDCKLFCLCLAHCSQRHHKQKEQNALHRISQESLIPFLYFVRHIIVTSLFLGQGALRPTFLRYCNYYSFLLFHYTIEYVIRWQRYKISIKTARK